MSTMLLLHIHSLLLYIFISKLCYSSSRSFSSYIPLPTHIECGCVMNEFVVLSLMESGSSVSYMVYVSLLVMVVF